MKKIFTLNSLGILGFIVVAALLTVQFTLIFALSSQLGHQNQQRLWDTRLIYACYNYDIHPCDDAGVTKWNEANPDKAVTAAYLQGK